MMRVTLLLLLTLGAIQAPDGSKPASSNVLNAQYPRVHADGRVTFRFTAPAAKRSSSNRAAPTTASARGRST